MTQMQHAILSVKFDTDADTLLKDNARIAVSHDKDIAIKEVQS